MMAAYGSSILVSLSALGVEIPGLDRLVKQNIDHEKFQLKDGLEEPSKLIKKEKRKNESNN